MGVNVAAHTRHIFLGSAPPGLDHFDMQFVAKLAIYNKLLLLLLFFNRS